MLRVTTAALSALLAATTFAAEFRGIPADVISHPHQLSSPIVQVSAISGDGSTIGGSLTETGVDLDCASTHCATLAFVWSHRDSKRRPLGELAINPFTSTLPKTVSALSIDGSTALVTYACPQCKSGLHRLDAVTPLRESIEEIGEWLTAYDMSWDAGVIVASLGGLPVRWTEAGGFGEFSGVDPGAGFRPMAISADGSTVVLNDLTGTIDAIGSTRDNAIRWTASED